MLNVYEVFRRVNQFAGTPDPTLLTFHRKLEGK